MQQLNPQLTHSANILTMARPHFLLSNTITFFFVNFTRVQEQTYEGERDNLNFSTYTEGLLVATTFYPVSLFISTDSGTVLKIG